MKRECIVYPTTRCIRETLAAWNGHWLPHLMSMGEFLSRVSVSTGKIVPDEDLRLLAMYEASDFSGFSGLSIDRHFYSFIQNSEYLFRFFEELAGEQVSLETLQSVDVYGEYEEHITILMRLRERYGALCEKQGWSDRIVQGEGSSVQEDFLSNYDTVTVVVEGYLSRYEMALLRQCAVRVETILHYTASAYNRKMTARLEELGFVLEEGVEYRLSLRTLEVIGQMPVRTNRSVECTLFHTRLAQVGFVKASVEAFVEEGMAPEKIAVILPDEGAASMLRAFDVEGNFNFAMGESFAETPLYRDWESITMALEESNVLNLARIRNIPSQTLEWFKSRYPEPFCYEWLEEALSMAQGGDETTVEMVRDELHRFAHLRNALERMDFKAVFRIFMNRLRNLTIDDVGGGKITVMGVLETRGIAFEGVVVIDFNEGYVPHKSEKDLFLNSKTREYAGLPSTYDRESLQKHYYAMLFNRARRVAIASVQNAESVPSRFLLQLGIKSRPAIHRYEEVLFPPPHFRERGKIDIETEYDFTAHPQSASSIRTFLSCRRKFYYRYCEQLREHELPRDLSQERDIGNELHRVLERVYTQRERFESASQIQEAVRSLWEEKKGVDPLERHMRRLWLEKLEPFFDREASRFAAGARVEHCEKELSALCEGVTLVGRIDRIDRAEGLLEVIDYKSGAFPDTDKMPGENDTDYQLSVYALLASTLGEVGRCGYYDLGRGELKFERYLEEKTAKLREILSAMASGRVWEWTMCDDLGTCRLCPYVYLCQREAMHGV